MRGAIGWSPGGARAGDEKYHMKNTTWRGQAPYWSKASALLGVEAGVGAALILRERERKREREREILAYYYPTSLNAAHALSYLSTYLIICLPLPLLSPASPEAPTH